MKRGQTFQIPGRLRVHGHAVPLDDLPSLCAEQNLPVEIRVTRGIDGEDSAAVDPTLHVEASTTAQETPSVGTGYAGLTPSQRAEFVDWAARPDSGAAEAYRRLYVANLEPALLESPERRSEALSHLQELAGAPAWRADLWLARALMLGCWLACDGALLAVAIGRHGLPATLLGTAFGLQALLNAPMTPAELGVAHREWIRDASVSQELLTLRLDSLATALGAEPLAGSLGQLGRSAALPRPWRTAHPNLRLSLPQPDLRPALEPLLRDMNLVADGRSDSEVVDLFDAGESAHDQGWHLILEFGQSRSDAFDYVLNLCRRLPDFSQILDQDRRMVYRVVFRRRDMRRFWRIWDVLQGWSSTRVYVNGDELEKWKIWPYSQYLA